jgi:hypothetical protein
MLELQAPQGPYTNVLDLQVFPAMSKRHSELLQVFSNTEADKDRIWKIALEIWSTMIIETKGDTDWLKNGAPHCNVRRDYADTERGVKRIEDYIEVGEDEPESSQCF